MTDEEKIDEERNPDGTFAKGNSGGLGRPKGTRLTWQSLADRIAHWRNKTIEEIELIINDKAYMKKMVTRDAEIVQQIWEAYEKKNSAERELLNDREVGKATSRSEFGGVEDGVPISVENTVTLKIDSA